VVFGLLDVACLLLFFLPFFAQRGEAVIRGVSLLNLVGISPFLRVAYFVLLIAMVLWGILTLSLQTCTHHRWLSVKSTGSLVLTALGVLLFMISLQPYAAGYLFAFLIIKGFMLMTRKVSSR
jgi:hypothetical protein